MACENFRVACGIQLPDQGLEPESPALGMQGLSHWTHQKSLPNSCITVSLPSPSQVSNTGPQLHAEVLCTTVVIVSEHILLLREAPKLFLLITDEGMKKKNHAGALSSLSFPHEVIFDTALVEISSELLTPSFQPLFSLEHQLIFGKKKRSRVRCWSLIKLKFL